VEPIRRVDDPDREAALGAVTARPVASRGPIVAEVSVLAAACHLLAAAMLWVELRRIPAAAARD